MNLIDRYIGKTMIEATLLALLVLLGMQSFISFVGELHDLGTKNYGLIQTLIYVPMQLPGYLYQFFPVAGLLGVVMGLGRLASHSELIVLRASGVSMARVIWSVVKAAIIMLIVITVIGEWFAPHWQYESDKRKAIAMSGGQAFTTQLGTWIRDGNNFIHINQVAPDGTLEGVMRYEFVNHALHLASYAETGKFQQGQWYFSDIDQSTISSDKVTSQHFDQQQWNVTFNPHLLRMAAIDPSQQSISRLYKYVQYLKQNNQSSNQTEFELWKRLFQPIATLVMIILGVPFVFGPLRSATMGLRILIGVVAGFGFYMLNEFFGPLSMVYQFPPVLAAAIPTLLIASVGGILLWVTR